MKLCSEKPGFSVFLLPHDPVPSVPIGNHFLILLIILPLFGF